MAGKRKMLKRTVATRKRKLLKRTAVAVAVAVTVGKRGHWLKRTVDGGRWGRICDVVYIHIYYIICRLLFMVRASANFEFCVLICSCF